MRLVDSHCHLDFEPMWADTDGVLERASAALVDRVVVPSYDAASRRRVVELAGRPGVFVALGLHPWAAAESFDPRELRRQIELTKAVAIGEVGLDTRVEQPSLTRQLQILETQVELAAELELPVILHCRGAFEEMLELLAPLQGRVRGVVHAYSRGPELARRILDLGLLLGIGGAATRSRAARLHRTLRAAPLECLVLETDAPSIGLEGVPPEAVEPRHVAQVAAAVAAIKGVDSTIVAAVTTATAETLFGGLV